ncbi:UDP-N-acetylmuramoyl-L-alanyl-D-glutamate--2,6-diaminopimelate ligase [Candidatus Saccharibacteria bacterium]|nr:UDP-N-acetylmuramoyl-L-alanyl-D-glutamate--2,6-diaminopimelate ligase [Candidatus Saccharibacteria bacterium]
MNPRKIVKKLFPKQVFQKIEPYGHMAEAMIAQAKYHFPAKNINVVGITGTDGKTTTCSLVASVLRAGGYRVGVLTTAYIDYGDGRGEQTNITNLTTGNAFALNRIISQMRANQVDWIVLETSSHALNQHRIWGIPITIAIMTNMSQEHLDYHGTFTNYQRAKEILFKMCNRNKHGLQTGVVNADDATADSFAKRIKNSISYGINKGELRAQDLITDLNGNRFNVKTDKLDHAFSTHLLGRFNTYNALSAIATGKVLGLSPEVIQRGLDTVQSVEGRMMPLDVGQPYKVLIDYAVTPGALESVLGTIRDIAGKGKVHIVFGATGDRDKTKRPAMGEVTSRLADKVYLTDDETYTEDASSIQSQVLSGASTKNKHKIIQFDDRQDAIASAISSARAGDIIVISGIGHQTTRNMGGKKIKWSDLEITKQLLQKSLESKA